MRLQPLLDLGVVLPVRAAVGADGERSVVLLLNTQCPACINSKPFYRRLRQSIAKTPATRFVVVVEESVEEARAWLAEDGIAADDVIAVRSWSKVGVVGTPTLLVVDRDGVISDIATRVLFPEEETHFMNRVIQPSVGESVRIGYFMRELTDSEALAEASRPGIQLLDTRTRLDFAQRHSAGATNIPQDELLARSPAELLRALPVFIDCRYDDQALCRIAGVLLRESGFGDVRIVLP